MTAGRTERSNSQWVMVLQADGTPAQQNAFRDLSDYLMRVVCTYIWRRGATLPGLAPLARQEQEALAQEFVQEALLTIYQKLGQYSGEGSFLGWATTVAVRIAGEELRKAHWQSARVAPGQEDAAAASRDERHPRFTTQEDKAPALDRQLQLQAILHLVEQAIDEELSEQQRQAFCARFVEGRSHEEIAADFATSPSIIYQRIHQARKKIKQRLLAAGYVIDDFL